MKFSKSSYPVLSSKRSSSKLLDTSNLSCFVAIPRECSLLTPLEESWSCGLDDSGDCSASNFLARKFRTGEADCVFIKWREGENFAEVLSNSLLSDFPLLTGEVIKGLGRKCCAVEVGLLEVLLLGAFSLLVVLVLELISGRTRARSGEPWDGAGEETTVHYITQNILIINYFQYIKIFLNF